MISILKQPSTPTPRFLSVLLFPSKHCLPVGRLLVLVPVQLDLALGPGLADVSRAGVVAVALLAPAPVVHVADETVGALRGRATVPGHLQ